MSKETRQPGPTAPSGALTTHTALLLGFAQLLSSSAAGVARRQLQVDAEPEGRRQCGPAESTGDPTARAAAGSTHGGVGTATEVGTVGVHPTWP